MSTPATHETIVVGVDGTAACAAAIRWAAVEAARRHARLHAVHVVDLDRHREVTGDTDPRGEVALARRTTPGRVASLVQAQGLDLDLDLAVSVVTGRVVDRLAHESFDAALVVVGMPDGPQHAGVPAELADRCLCPVVVVPQDGDVVVVDSSPVAVTLNRQGASHARA